jgi:hypothetical protein
LNRRRMLGATRTFGLSRFAALLIVVALSGALQPVAAHPGAVAASLCRCGAHAAGPKHTCPRCHGARQVALEKGPPCHQAAAHAEVAQERRRQESGLPCLSSGCGLPEAPQAVARAIGESFTLPENPPLSRPSGEETLCAGAVSPPQRVTAPETPPPRPV